ncbi:MAG: hypothetical protein ACI9S8_001492 [Chlamydiales bacterium]|jgi:hypothetical protein
MSIPSQPSFFCKIPATAQVLVAEFATGVNVCDKAPFFQAILNKATGDERDDALEVTDREVRKIALIDKSSFSEIRDDFESLVRGIDGVTFSALPPGPPLLFRQVAVIDAAALQDDIDQAEQASLDQMRTAMQNHGLI